MRFGVQRQQTLLVTTELVIWRYANAFIFTNQSELDFGIAYVYWQVALKQKRCKTDGSKRRCWCIFCVKHGVTKRMKNTNVILMLLKNKLNSISPH
jgi:hypothetical protein